MPAADIPVDQSRFDDPLTRAERLDIVLTAATARRDPGIAVAAAETVDDGDGIGLPGIVAEQRSIGARLDQNEVVDGAARRETEFST